MDVPVRVCCLWCVCECHSGVMLVGMRVVIIIELLQKRTFEDVLFFCVVELWFMVFGEKSGD